MSANVDGRYPHYLSRLQSGDGPARILCVDLDGTLSSAGRRTDDIIETVAGWSVVELVRTAGRLQYRARVAGDDIAGLWTLLASRCEHVGTSWVLSYQCSRIWALAELWSRLESGEVRISGGDYRAVSDPDTYGEDATPGILIAEDPPCLAQLRIGHHQGSLLWLDCRNWGIELPETLSGSADVSSALAALVVSVEDACQRGTLGTIAPTAAGQSYRAFRTAHMPIVPHCHTHPRVVELEMDGHVGGRCECYYLGRVDGTVYHLDIRSCYGYVMAASPVPIRLIDYMPPSAGCTPGDSQSYLGTIAKVDIRTNEPAYPFRRDTDTIYPVGSYTTVLCGPELMDAVAHDRVTWIHCAARYELGYAMRSFADAVYTVRHDADERGDDMLSAWSKYVLNGVVGKLAQRLKRWEVVPGAIAPEPWGEWQYLSADGELQRWRSMAGIVQRELHGGYAPDAVPAIAAWICSYGRTVLLDAIRCAGWEDVYYVDTDGLLVSHTGYRRLQLDGRVSDGVRGKLELRGHTDECEIRGIKYYLEGDDVRCAGTTRGISVRSADGRGQWLIQPGAAGAKLHGPTGHTRRLQKWPKPPAYRHGIVQPDGTILPHRLGGYDGEASD